MAVTIAPSTVNPYEYMDNLAAKCKSLWASYKQARRNRVESDQILHQRRLAWGRQLLAFRRTLAPQRSFHAWLRANSIAHSTAYKAMAVAQSVVDNDPQPNNDAPPPVLTETNAAPKPRRTFFLHPGIILTPLDPRQRYIFGEALFAHKSTGPVHLPQFVLGALRRHIDYLKYLSGQPDPALLEPSTS